VAVAKPDRATSSFADDAPGSRAFYSRPGNDLTHRFPLIVEALARLRSRTCIIDGEAVACGDDGVAPPREDAMSARACARYGVLSGWRGNERIG
jgi:hypothetical protein